MEDKYAPDEFRKCARLRGIASSPVIDDFLRDTNRTTYYERDFIDLYRRDELARKGKKDKPRMIEPDYPDWDGGD